MSCGLQVLRSLPTDSATRADLFHSLLSPADTWGPALPEIFRKYSESHGFGLQKSAGDDDVFGDADVEMTGARV